MVVPVELIRCLPPHSPPPPPRLAGAPFLESPREVGPHVRKEPPMPMSPADVCDFDRQPTAEGPTDPARLVERMREELRELEPVVTAATLATVAFRMRDESGLVAALRALTDAVDELERRRGDC